LDQTKNEKVSYRPPLLKSLALGNVMPIGRTLPNASVYRYDVGLLSDPAEISFLTTKKPLTFILQEQSIKKLSPKNV